MVPPSYLYFARPPQSDPKSIDTSATPMPDLFRGAFPQGFDFFEGFDLPCEWLR
jgi:hypothetical protein